MSRINTITLMSAVALGAALLSGCDNSANLMAEQAMMGGNARYDSNGNLMRPYTYYPDQQVFRSVYHYTWYWKEDNGWHHGSSLPSTFALGNDSVFIQLPTGHPHTMINEVVAMHPSTDMLYAKVAEQESDELLEAMASVPTD